MIENKYFKAIILEQDSMAIAVINDCPEIEEAVDGLFSLSSSIDDAISNVSGSYQPISILKQLFGGLCASYPHAIYSILHGLILQGQHFSRRGIEALRLTVVCLENPALFQVWRYSKYGAPDEVAALIQDCPDSLNLPAEDSKSSEEKLFKNRFYWQGAEERFKRKPKIQTDMEYLDIRYKAFSNMTVHMNWISLAGVCQYDGHKTVLFCPFPKAREYEISLAALESADVWLRSLKVLVEYFADISGFVINKDDIHGIEEKLCNWALTGHRKYPDSRDWGKVISDRV
jgi:hypothetical protein